MTENSVPNFNKVSWNVNNSESLEINKFSNIWTSFPKTIKLLLKPTIHVRNSFCGSFK